MKNTFHTLFFVLLISSVIYSANFKEKIYCKEKRQVYTQDTTFIYQKEFQDYVDVLITDGFLDLTKERGSHFLDTEDKMKEYVKFLTEIKCPECEMSTINISEDRTKEIWFAYYQIKNHHMRNNMQIIVCKKSFKVLMFQVDK